MDQGLTTVLGEYKKYFVDAMKGVMLLRDEPARSATLVKKDLAGVRGLYLKAFDLPWPVTAPELTSKIDSLYWTATDMDISLTPLVSKYRDFIRSRNVLADTPGYPNHSQAGVDDLVEQYLAAFKSMEEAKVDVMELASQGFYGALGMTVLHLLDIQKFDDAYLELKNVPGCFTGARQRMDFRAARDYAAQARYASHLPALKACTLDSTVSQIRDYLVPHLPGGKLWTMAQHMELG